jgi:peroxiredoxin Q/BCP
MNKGDLVPNFSAPDQSGTVRDLSSFLHDGHVVLFFYPAALTKGCTMESCHFRDLKAEFEALGAQRLGISMDTVAKQAAFADTHHLDYPLLSDSDGAIAKTFGVKRALNLLRTKRSTFVINTDSRVVAVINSELSMNRHADDALAALRDLQSSSS